MHPNFFRIGVLQYSTLTISFYFIVGAGALGALGSRYGSKAMKTGSMFKSV